MYTVPVRTNKYVERGYIHVSNHAPCFYCGFGIIGILRYTDKKSQ